MIARNPYSTEYVADPVEQKTAGLWLKEHEAGDKIIMSRNHAVDFYAGNYNIAESVTIPTNSLDRVLAYAKHRGVNYIVLNERYLQDYSDLGFLIKGTAEIPEGLKLLYKVKDASGLTTVIYKLLQ